MSVPAQPVRTIVKNTPSSSSSEPWRDLGIAAVYAVSGILWILFSTHVLPDTLGLSPEARQRFELTKGYLFMLVTSALFFALLRAHSRHQQALRNQIARSEEMANHHARVLGMLASGEAAGTCLTELVRGVEARRAPVLGCVALMNSAGELAQVYAPSLPLDFCRKIAATPAHRAVTLGKESLIVVDAASDPSMETVRDEVLARGLHACWWLPITAEDGSMLGVLAMFHPRAGGPAAHDMSAAERTLVTARMIVEHDRTRARLAESERIYRDLVEEAPVGICIASDASNSFKSVNPALVQMLGYSSKEELGKLALDRDLYSGDLDERRAFYSALRKDGSCDILLRWRRKDGRRVLVRCQATVIQRDEASVTARIFCEDVSAKQEMEARTQQAQRLESIGRLAGGIAHDFNNILMVAQSYAELLEPLVIHHEQGARFLREIIKASGRAADLTRQLLAFSRKQPFTPEAVDLNEKIRGSLTSWTRLMGKRVKFTTRLADNLPPCLVDAAQLEQVLLNLLLNARDAMPDGGEIVVETALDTAAPRRRVCLKIVDSGRGIPADVLPNIFDPFFTTKDPGKGTGLGLASVYGIVERAGGDVKVSSTLGEGTTFRVYLPVAEGRCPPQPAKPDMPHSGALTGTVLIVEDEEAILETLGTVSSDMGLTVLRAASAEEAMRFLEQERPIHLLVTDVVMPGMSGVELADSVRRRFPSTRILVVSGYARGEHEQALQNYEFLLKPIRLDQFRNTLRRILDTAPK